MDFSVIICTYNRAGNLPRCLGALARQQGVEALRWEVVVVDNNSKDGTKAEVERLSRELPITVRYAFEGQQGLNYARNTGIRESTGTCFSYVDDDIEVSPRWLASLHRSFVTHDADAVGGRIHLDPGIKLPAWIRDEETKGFLGYQDFGDEVFRMDGRRRYPYGGNMAFNRRVVDRIGYFNPLLGRKGEGRKRSELFKGAETDYFHRLADSGEVSIWYEPDAIVYHQVQPFQPQKKYFRTIHSNAGYQRAFYDSQQFPHTIFGVPRYLYPMLLGNVAEYLRQLVVSGPNVAFRQQMTVGHMIGTMLGYHRRAAAHAMSGIGDRSRAVLKGAARAVLRPFNLTITRVVTDTGCAREWVAESGLTGMAVNDYIEKDQRKPARQELERLVFPRVTPQATLCELGPGTGVYTRYLNDYVDGGRLHVVDADPSAVDFLRRHLPRKPGTELHCNSGTSLPIEADGSVDLVFCASMFTGGNLSYFYRYLQEFERVLKPGGWAVFDYHDVATEAGWQSLLRNMRRKQPIFAYAYHATDTVDRVLQHLGLEVQERWPTARGSVFVSARKPA